MTSKIEEMLNLPSMSEVSGMDVQPIDDYNESELDAYLDKTEAVAVEEAFIEDIRKGDGHAKAMDDVYTRMLGLSDEIRDLALNVDQRGAATLFEKAIMAMKAAADAKDSKRDMQLKAMKLMNERRRLSLEERKFEPTVGDTEEGGFIQGTAMDRNDLIRRILEEKPPVDYHEKFDDETPEEPAPDKETISDEDIDSIIADQKSEVVE